MKAVIFSSGDGTRLRPVTCSIPHCMLPVMGRPVIEHTVRLLSRHNITDITIASSYLTDEIKKHFSFYPVEGISINFRSINDFCDLFTTDDVLLISDSILFDTDLGELLSIHRHSGSDVTAVTKHTSAAYRYGIFQIGKEGFATEYTSCPDFAQVYGIPFMGIAVIRKGISMTDCRSFHSMMEKLVKSENNIYCYTPDSYIRDISDFDSYHRCCRDFMDKKIFLPFPCEEKAPSVWIDENATVMQGAVITPPVYIGPGSIITKGARVEAYCQICRDVTVDCFSSIKRSTVMDNSYISENVSLRGTIIGKRCHIGDESAAYEGSVIGFGSKIGKHCVVRTSVHIWPDKLIEDESCVNENITWDNTIRNTLFYSGCAEGVINRELTPEFALQLARAAVKLTGNKIAVSCEDEGAGLMIKNALIAGIQSAGGKAYDMGEQPLPITRSAVKFYSLDGGIALSVRSDKSSLYGTLDIIDSRGINLEYDDTGKLGQIINDLSAKKIAPQDITAPEFLYEYKLYYLKQLINSTSKKPLGAKILIHAPSPWAKELLKSAAADLNCTFVFSKHSDKESFSKELTLGNYDMGAICDYKCETLTLVTSAGYVLSEFDYCGLTSLIIMKFFPDSTIYVPESAPDSIEVLAKKYNASVHRTNLNPPILMNELSKSNQKMLLHQFIYRYDAVGAIIILLDCLYTNNLTVESLLTEIPPTNVITTTVTCPKAEQRNAIKQLYSHHKAEIPRTANSLKINFDNGWVLVVPDRDRSLIKVISYAVSKEYAREIADICIDDIANK